MLRAACQASRLRLQAPPCGLGALHSRCCIGMLCALRPRGIWPAWRSATRRRGRRTPARPVQAGTRWESASTAAPLLSAVGAQAARAVRRHARVRRWRWASALLLPLTPVPAYAHCHLRSFPLTLIPAHARSRLRSLSLALIPTYTHSRSRPFPPTPVTLLFQVRRRARHWCRCQSQPRGPARQHVRPTRAWSCGDGGRRGKPTGQADNQR